MKIAVFTDVFLEVPGGIPSSIKAQKKSLEVLGHQVTVFCPGYSTSLHNKGKKTGQDEGVVLVPTHKHLKFGGAPVSKSPEKVEEFIMREYPMFDFDVVHVHYEASCSIAGMRLARRFKVPLVQTMHGREDMAVGVNIPHPFKTIVAIMLNLLHRQYIPEKTKVQCDKDLAPTLARAKMWTLMVNHANFADRVITPSKHFAKKLKKYGVKKPIAVVSNGVDDELVKELDNKNLIRVRSIKEPLRIFWNSRVSKEKRIIPFMKALAMMKQPYEFTVCGNGNALDMATKFAAKHKVNAKFCGLVPHEEMLEKMLGQHVSATVSYGFDTQGLTLLEAEATGMPVFFCDPDMEESMPAGSFVMADGPSAEQMSKALDELASKPEKIEQMSKVMLGSRADILQSTQIKKLLDCYHFLLD